MKYLLGLLIGLFLPLNLLQSQPTIYDDNTSLISGIWNQNGTLVEVGSNTPFEGSLHYQFSYNYTGHWAGVGLNLNNWGGGPTYDFSAYTHIRLAYRGMSGVQGATLALRSSSSASNIIELGGPTTDYVEVDVPLFAFLAGTSLDLSNITEINLSVTGSDANGNGTFYFDDIQLVNIGGGTVTSAATWQRANAMHRGVNYSNWLEAYWLIPFGAYPESDKFSADLTADFRNLGFDAIRLPVTFENLAANNPPYTLDTDHEAFDLIDDAIQWAATYDMKLIIDLHHGDDLTDANFQTELPRLKAIWQQIIDRYDGLDPNRYLFEVYNEPYAISNANFRIVAEELVSVIRDAGATHSIIVGASGFNSATDLFSFTPLDDPDIIYTFHFYGPYEFTHQQLSFTSTFLPARDFPIGDDVANVSAQINGVGEWSMHYNAPVIAGEFGVSMNAADEDRCNWITTIAGLFEDNALPWFYWGSIDLSDGFGFFNNGIVSEASMIDCFGTALGLPSVILAVSDLEGIQLDCQGDDRLLSWNLHTDESASIIIEGYQAGSDIWEGVGNLVIHPEQTRYAYRLGQHDQSSYYRLRIEESDGSISYSSVVTNNCLDVSEWKIFPNPTYSRGFYLQGMNDDKADVYLYNSLGQEVARYNDIRFTTGEATFLPVTNLSAGSYWLKIARYQGQLHWERIVIGR